VSASNIGIAARPKWPPAHSYEVQRPKIFARAGSTAALKAGSHPSGTFRGKADVIGDEDVGPRAGATFCGSRSPFLARSTETMVVCPLRAAAGTLTAQKPPASRQLTNTAAITALRSKKNDRPIGFSRTVSMPRSQAVIRALAAHCDDARDVCVATRLAAITKAGRFIIFKAVPAQPMRISRDSTRGPLHVLAY
jgi:hypothetical protein